MACVSRMLARNLLPSPPGAFTKPAMSAISTVVSTVF